MIEEITQPKLFDTDPYETVTEQELEAYESIKNAVNLWDCFVNTKGWLDRLGDYQEGHYCTVKVNEIAPFSILDLSSRFSSECIEHRVEECNLTVDLRKAEGIGRVITNFVQGYCVYSNGMSEKSYEF